MWDELFDQSMIGIGLNVAISCQDYASERECAELLHSLGVRYPAGNILMEADAWDDYKSEFCYFVEGFVARRGERESPYPYNTFRKTYFEQDNSMDEIDDTSFDEIIGRRSDGTA